MRFRILRGIGHWILANHPGVTRPAGFSKETPVLRGRDE